MIRFFLLALILTFAVTDSGYAADIPIPIPVGLFVFIGLLVGTAGLWIVVVVVRQSFVAIKTRKLKKQIKKLEVFHDSVYKLAALLICADGVIDKEELAVTKAIGEKLLGGFDGKLLSELCKSPSGSPKKLISEIKKTLSPEERMTVLTFLHSIAMADGTLHDAERSLIRQVASGFGFNPDDLPALSEISPHAATYSLAAHIISADGKLEDEEIRFAIQFGEQLMDGFNKEELMNYCSNPETIPDLDKISLMLARFLSNEERGAVLGYLAGIAMSDGEVHDRELKILQKISRHWRIDLADFQSGSAA